MKIIYGITKSNFGGAQRYVFDLATAAQAAGHDIAVMCGGNGVLVEKLKERGIRIISIGGMRRDISLIDELRSFHFIFRTLYEEKPDVFHTNSSKMGGIGNLAARLAGVHNIIFTSHGWAFNEPRPQLQKIIIKFLVWLTVLLSRKTISVSERSREDIAGLPFIKHKLAVIHNGVEPFDLLPWDAARHALGIAPGGKIIVGTIAELHRVKGLDVLLEAWQKFAEKYEAELAIIGDGEERANLARLSHKLGTTDSVSFKGFVENARQYLNAFDIFVLPSRSENLPYAVLEAGFAGVPVVASRVGGIPEVIETGENGILVTPEDPRELLSSLILLASDKELRFRLGSNLKEKVLGEFSIRKMVEQTLKLY
ncbi:glycosyltransferase family 4 protein [Candidatus Parcubacteria bacterium]|nr:glycosyltransferase family 4 protein [Candidatus Parcubacteria bacterium]